MKNINSLSQLILVILLFSFTAFTQNTDIKKQLEEITVALQNNKHDEVIQITTNIIEKSPKSAELYSLRGIAYYSKNEKEKALADFSQAINLGIEPRLEVTTRRMKGLILYQIKKYDEAIIEFNLILKADKSEYRDHFYRGWCYFYKADHKAAIADFDAVLQQKPTELHVRRFRAISHLSLGNNDKVVEDVTEEIKLNPKHNLEVYSIRAKAYRKLGKNELAEADEKKFIELGGSDKDDSKNNGKLSQSKIDELVEKATTNFKAKEWKLAIQFYTEIINNVNQKDNGLYSIYFSRGRCFFELGDYDKALLDYNENIKRKPELAAGYIFRGEVYLKKEQIDLAIADFDTGINTKNNESILVLGLRRRAEAFYLKKEFAKSIKDCESVLKLNPQYRSAWYYRSASNLELGEIQTALADINQYIKLGENDSEGYKLRAKIYHRLDDKTSAEADEKKAIEIEVKNNE